jgi:acetyl-CoA carboxylase biotin carboxyl carrier protein
MDLRKLKTLIDLVAESGITELEVTEGEGKVRIVKGSNTPVVPTQTFVMPTAAAPMAAMPTAVAGAAPVTAAATPTVAEQPQGNVVKSPMVGTFYRSPGPGKPAFVEVGQAVKTDQTVCIIEAMKLLNEIECGFEGTIKQILVENGQPVEYGQPLFVVE